MNFIRANIILFSAAVFFFSCSDRKITERVKALDSLLALNDSLTGQLEAIDLDSVNKVFLESKSFTELFGEKLMALPENDSVRVCLYQNGDIFKGMKRFLNEYPRIMKDLEFSREQLGNLKSDAASDLLSDKDYSAYFSDEKKALDLLCEDVSVQVSKISHELSTFNRIRKTVGHFADSLKKMVVIKKEKTK